MLWPAISKVVADNPDIAVEVSVNAGFVDIVAEQMRLQDRTTVTASFNLAMPNFHA